MKGLARTLNVKTAKLVGGIPEEEQDPSGADAVMATPWRACDAAQRELLDLSSFTHVAIDEYDQIVSCGFASQLETIFCATEKTARYFVCQTAGVSEAGRKIEGLLRGRRGVEGHVSKFPSLEGKHQFYIDCDQDQWKVRECFAFGKSNTHGISMRSCATCLTNSASARCYCT